MLGLCHRAAIKGGQADVFSASLQCRNGVTQQTDLLYCLDVRGQLYVHTRTSVITPNRLIGNQPGMFFNSCQSFLLRWSTAKRGRMFPAPASTILTELRFSNHIVGCTPNNGWSLRTAEFTPSPPLFPPRLLSERVCVSRADHTLLLFTLPFVWNEKTNIAPRFVSFFIPCSPL